MKLLVLIIASDDREVYIELQKLWKIQFKSHEDVTYYFLKGYPNLNNEVEIHEDTIWVRCIDDFYAGILTKTIKAIKSLVTGYDYVLRTNLSSFYVFENLIKTLEKFPRKNCYAGILGMANHNPPISFVSGCGFVMSKDICESLPSEPTTLWSTNHPNDDVSLGKFIFANFPNSYMAIPRIDIHSPEDPVIFPTDAIHYRVKTSDHDYEIRKINDIKIRRQLIDHFYPNLKDI